MKNFKLSNVKCHWKSTLFAVLLAAAAVLLVYFDKATWTEISPVLLIIIPFLLYGHEKNNDNAATGSK
ncbi:MAG: hypothetical protein KatS3mg031_2877 [Chitinophagales bacterium]|nr:MAG: hypothetical protein KatS3mg031_2877 [Chitinophagales bacterium]